MIGEAPIVRGDDNGRLINPLRLRGYAACRSIHRARLAATHRPHAARRSAPAGIGLDGLPEQGRAGPDRIAGSRSDGTRSPRGLDDPTQTSRAPFALLRTTWRGPASSLRWALEPIQAATSTSMASASGGRAPSRRISVTTSWPAGGGTMGISVVDSFMAGYSPASQANRCARYGCITEEAPPPSDSPPTTFGDPRSPMTCGARWTGSRSRSPAASGNGPNAYANPLPKLVRDVEALAARVDAHLARMGFRP